MRQTNEDASSLGLSPADIDVVLDVHVDFRAREMSAMISRKDYLAEPQLQKAQESRNIPRLETVTRSEFVAWWPSFAQALHAFNFWITPFHALNLKYEEFGLIIPGIGLRKYDTMNRALLILLKSILPLDAKPRLRNRYDEGCMTSGGGSRLLWLLGRDVVKFFDATTDIPKPSVPSDGDLHTWMALCKMYRSCRRIRGDDRFSARDESVLFLEGLMNLSKYAQVARSLHFHARRVPFIPIPKALVIPDGDRAIPEEFRVETLAYELTSTSSGDIPLDADRVWPLQ